MIFHLPTLTIEVVAAQPPMPRETVLFHVTLPDGSAVWLFRCARDEDWHSILPIRGCPGGRVSDAERADLQALPGIIAQSFPELCGAQP